MSFSFSISWTSDQEYVFTCWGNLSQLIESQALSLSGSNSLSSFIGESKSTYSKSFRYVQESSIVGDRSNNSKNSGVEFSLSLWYWSFVLRECFGNP